MGKEIKEAKSHLEWLLNNGILATEDEPHIKNILKYIEDLENENKKYKYSKIPYLEGYIKGLEKGIEELNKENKNNATTYKLWMNNEDYEYPFGLGYDYNKTSYCTNNTKDETHKKWICEEDGRM